MASRASPVTTGGRPGRDHRTNDVRRHRTIIRLPYRSFVVQYFRTTLRGTPLRSPLHPDALTIPMIDAAASARGAGLISFAGGAAHPSDLPLAGLGEAIDLSLSPRALAYGAARGEPELLAALRGHFAHVEGIDADAERMMITSGAMPALDLVFRRAIEPGDLVLVESPTYSDSLIALSLARASIAEVPMDSDGLQVEELPAVF